MGVKELGERVKRTAAHIGTQMAESALPVT